MLAGKLEKGLNCSFIAFIPEAKNPTSLKDYRPISLVNSLHKILARLLANQLKKVIFTVIRDTQSTFNNGHQIMDSILFANKINHNMKKMHITKEVSLSNLTLRRHLIVLIGILFYVSWRPWVSALNGEGGSISASL